MFLKSKYLVLLVLLLSSACTKYTTVRQHPNFHPDELSRSLLIVLPSEAEVYTIGALGSKERMYDFEGYIEDLIDDSLQLYLRQKGYNVVSLTKKNSHSLSMSGEVLKTRERYNPEFQKLYSRYSLPLDQALNISSSIGAGNYEFSNTNTKKYFVFCNYSHFSKTSGARAAGFVIDVLVGSNLSHEAENSTLALGIIDQKTGDIVWGNMHSNVVGIFFSSSKSSNEEHDRKHIKDLIEYTTKPLFKEESK